MLLEHQKIKNFHNCRSIRLNPGDLKPFRTQKQEPVEKKTCQKQVHKRSITIHNLSKHWFPYSTDPMCPCPGSVLHQAWVWSPPRPTLQGLEDGAWEWGLDLAQILAIILVHYWDIIGIIWDIIGKPGRLILRRNGSWQLWQLWIWIHGDFSIQRYGKMMGYIHDISWYMNFIFQQEWGELTGCDL